jgi:predicted ATP-binding protein involved in virulence
MHHIRRIEIDGFWDNHNLKLRLHPDVNFFIGPNGTGKTTLINLIAAALTVDLPTLMRIPFRKITIGLNSTEGQKSPSISVTKLSVANERSNSGFEYRVRKNEGGEEERLLMTDPEEVVVRGGQLVRRWSMDHRKRSPVSSVLAELVHVQWLSVHRSISEYSSRDDRAYESMVDRKLESLSNELVRYFATFSKQKDDKVREFQEYIFVSLLEQTGVNQIFERDEAERLLDHEMTVAEIFKELHVQNTGIDELIKSFFEKAAVAAKKAANDPITAEDFALLVSLRKIREVTDRWNKLQEQLKIIFAQRDQFITIVNQLLQRKKVEISDSNELVFISRSGKALAAQMLSSGEKQLLILLSEVLLQRQRPSIFIADEPELSLHVSWQEKLVPSLRALNVQAQILAATHSPDIVGALADKTFDMETIIP